jgi:hypothetical protein
MDLTSGVTSLKFPTPISQVSISKLKRGRVREDKSNEAFLAQSWCAIQNDKRDRKVSEGIKILPTSQQNHWAEICSVEDEKVSLSMK